MAINTNILDYLRYEIYLSIGFVSPTTSCISDFLDTDFPRLSLFLRPASSTESRALDALTSRGSTAINRSGLSGLGTIIEPSFSNRLLPEDDAPDSIWTMVLKSGCPSTKLQRIQLKIKLTEPEFSHFNIFRPKLTLPPKIWQSNLPSHCRRWAVERNRGYHWL